MRMMWAALTIAAATSVASAHDSPQHVIDDLTVRMLREGRTAELLYRRGVEYRIFGKLDRAANDLQAAIVQDPRLISAYRELIRVQLATNDVPAATQTLSLGKPFVQDAEAPAWQMLGCEVSVARGDFPAALQACQAACQLRPNEAEWALRRSQLQRQLGQTEQRVTDLADAQRHNPSIVLRHAWIDALLDCGRFDEASPAIEAELAVTRWQAAWLIRRARVRLATDEQTAAHEDLRAAIAEITPRLRAHAPDLSLLRDRAAAYELLGDEQAAAADLKRAAATTPIQ